MPTTFAAYDESGQIPASPVLVVPNAHAAFLVTALLEMKWEPQGLADPYKIFLMVKGTGPVHRGIKENLRVWHSRRIRIIASWAAERRAKFGWTAASTP